MILVACGLAREARWLAGDGVVAIPGGGDEAALEAALEARAGEARAILSMGLAGGLAPRLRAGDWVVGTIAPTGIERREWSVGTGMAREAPVRIAEAAPVPGQQSEGNRRWIDTIARVLPGAVIGRIHADGQMVPTVAEKHALHLATRAIACDMESHVAARVAARHGLPFAVARVVSDPADRPLPRVAIVAMAAGGGIALGAVAWAILSRPWEWPALARLARDTWRAARVLKAGAARLAAAGFALDR